MNNILTFNTIPSLIIKQIGQFLTQQESITLSQISHQFRTTVLSQDFHSTYQINQKISNSKLFIYWLSAHIDLIKPKSLILTINGQSQEFTQILTIVESVKQYLQNLKLKIDTGIEELDLRLLTKMLSLVPNLKSISTNILSEDQQFQGKINKSEQLEITNQSFFVNQNHIKLFPPLKKLFLRPYEINWTALVNYFSQNQNIEELKLDCENCQEQLFEKFIQSLNRETMTLLKLSHLENLESNNLILFSKLIKLKSLSLLKTFSVSCTAWLDLCKSSKYTYLQSLNLTEAINLEDKALCFLIDKSVNLKHVNLSWCNRITSYGISYLINKCQILQELVVVGIKELNDDAFEDFSKLKKIFNELQYVNYKNEIRNKSRTIPEFRVQNFFNDKVQNPTKLKRIKLIDCQSVNFVSDNVLKIIGLFRINCKITNYYGNSMGVHDLQNQQDYF